VSLGQGNAGNTWSARVAAVEFLGAAWRATLACPDLSAEPILADFSSRDMREMNLREGQTLAISVAPQHLHVFAE
jgi:iron(III) transport system ATP-binding protein